LASLPRAYPGEDETGIILNQQASQIGAFEASQRAAKPWLYRGE
jgi:hypothetical protein